MKKILSFFLIFSLIVTPINVLADSKSTQYKFSDIDLKVKVPNELICFTRTTTNNNAYLEKIGATDANEVQSHMSANNIYLEVFPDDISYEIAVIGFKAADGLNDLKDLSESELKELFNKYVESQTNKESEELTETMTDSFIDNKTIPYFVTCVTGVTADKRKIYTKKYYTINRGYVYVYSLQSNNKEISDEMSDNLNFIVDSAEYVKVKKSIFENGVLMETLSSIFTVAVPIGILAAILFFLTKVGKKNRQKLADEEAKLRAEYKAKHNSK